MDIDTRRTVENGIFAVSVKEVGQHGERGARSALLRNVFARCIDIKSGDVEFTYNALGRAAAEFRDGNCYAGPVRET